MIYTQFQSPGFSQVQARLARVPRWAWVAFFIPLIAIFLAVIVIGLIVVAVVFLVATIARIFSRLFSRPRRTSNEIVVRAVRVVDP